MFSYYVPICTASNDSECGFDILGVQISSLFFFVFKNAFISKQNEWTDQLKYYPSLPTTFSISQAIFEFHLEKMTRLWRRIFQFWSQFSAKEVKRWLAASFRTTSSQKEQCPENTAGTVKSHLSISKYFFTTWALSWRRLTLSCLRSYFGRFSRNARLKRINCSRYRSPVMELPGFSNL